MLFNDRIREIPNMKFLIYAETEADGWIIASVLNEYGIPTHMDPATFGGSLSVIMGPNTSGINIYVPESEYEAALEIMNSEIEGLPEDMEE
ncbi:MAG: DUF2007 domain-containing protein [Eubacteriaceae bacterium]|nr:DUF2007 domain-containing protein [Eubacteriaceae bacterium]